MSGYHPLCSVRSSVHVRGKGANYRLSCTAANALSFDTPGRDLRAEGFVERSRALGGG
jgi:hypothetical protein